LKRGVWLLELRYELMEELEEELALNGLDLGASKL